MEDRHQLLVWETELGFVAGTIEVERFFVAERWIGIRDLPDHYQEYLDDPGAFDEQRRRELAGDVQEWRRRGDFVLYWDEDYYLNADGRVESS